MNEREKLKVNVKRSVIKWAFGCRLQIAHCTILPVVLYSNFGAIPPVAVLLQRDSHYFVDGIAGRSAL